MLVQERNLMHRLIWLMVLSVTYVIWKKEYFVTGINSPNNQYLNIHDLLMPKDY